MIALQARFADLLQRHVRWLRVIGHKATGCAPCHEDRHPSFSANIETCVWYCFTCARGGGVKDFALLVGEEWAFSTGKRPTRERARYAVLARRRQAEEQARAILQRRQGEREEVLWAAWREVDAEAAALVELLALFHRRPGLAEEFPELLAGTDREYSEAVFAASILEARLDGEVVA